MTVTQLREKYADTFGEAAEVRKLSIQLRPGEDNGELVGRLADLHVRIGTVETWVGKVREQITSVTAGLIPEEQAARALSAFDPVWGP